MIELGPYKTLLLEDTYRFDELKTKCGRLLKFQIFLTIPEQQKERQRLPLVVLINGFQVSPYFYSPAVRYSPVRYILMSNFIHGSLKNWGDPT